MNSILKKLVVTQAILLGALGAQANEVERVEARFNPATSSQTCSQLLLSHLGSKIDAFEADGTLKVAVDVTTDKGQVTGLDMAVNHRAYVPFFSTDKTPVPYEGGPQLVHVAKVDPFLPRVTNYNVWYLKGYTIPFERVLNEIEQGSDSLYVKQTLESARRIDPSPSEISLIRTAELSIDSEEIVLEITRGYNMNDPRIPKYYKTVADWTKDLRCVLQRN